MNESKLAQQTGLEPDHELPAPEPRPALPAPEPMPELPAPEHKLELPSPEPMPESPVPEPKPALPTRQAHVPSSNVSYTVRQGETLWGIAKKFGTTVEALVTANDLPDHKNIRSGQKLTIPR